VVVALSAILLKTKGQLCGGLLGRQVWCPGPDKKVETAKSQRNPRHGEARPKQVRIVESREREGAEGALINVAMPRKMSRTLGGLHTHSMLVMKHLGRKKKCVGGGKAGGPLSAQQKQV